MCLVVRTFLSVILWGITLSFDWNLLLFLLLLSGLFFFYLVQMFYEFIIAYKKYLSTYFLKKFKFSDNKYSEIRTLGILTLFMGFDRLVLLSGSLWAVKRRSRRDSMQYRLDRKGTPLSILGYGCLRFTKKNGRIDLNKAEEEIMEAVRKGVNYFDTAYVYHGSEAALGEILKRNHCRDQVYIATKLPHYLMKSRSGLERCFQEQLRRLQTDYVDYYLMHMLNDAKTWEVLKEKGVQDWVEEKLRLGQIRNIGFSYHGNTIHFKKLLDAYDWDFCQIQYNYMDEHTQAGREGLLYAGQKGIPVIIMEPLRGGKLVDLLPGGAREVFAEKGQGRTPADWAFRWLWNQKEVTVVLSGMNSLQMVRENVETASSAKAGELTKEEQELYQRVKQEIERSVKVSCTACGYCMPCPQGIDIPGTFRCYNEMYTEHPKVGRKEYLMTTAFRKSQNPASGCIQCGRCERLCPQQIEIRKELKQAAGELEDLRYKWLAWLVRVFRIWR